MTPTEDIKPFLGLLYSTTLTKLEDRSDFQTILQQKYTLTFSIKWLPTLLFSSITYLNQRLSHLKSYLLDHKSFSVRQTFKVFSRVESLLKQHFKIDELQQEDVFMASTMRQHIIEEIADVYLGYLYDKEVK